MAKLQRVRTTQPEDGANQARRRAVQQDQGRHSPSADAWRRRHWGPFWGPLMRMVRQRAGNADALAVPAVDLVLQVFGMAEVQANLFEQGIDRFGQQAGRDKVQDREPVGDTAGDPPPRVEAGVRILKTICIRCRRARPSKRTLPHGALAAAATASASRARALSSVSWPICFFRMVPSFPTRKVSGTP